MKQDILSNLLILATGAAIGSAITWVVMKRKYDSFEYIYEDEDPDENTLEEEERVDGPIVKSGDRVEPVKRKDMVRYNKIVKDAGYSGPEEEKEERDVDKPYIIPESEFSELEGYNVETLYYYEDGVLTDDQNNIIDDVDDIVGEETLSEFEENEDCDSIYVRNDKLKCDYEILRDMGRYSEQYPRED